YSDKGVTSLLFDVLDAEVFLKSYSETVFSLLEDYHNVAGEGEQEHYYKQTTQLLRDLSNELGWPEELQELAKKHVDVALKLVEKSQDIKNHLKRMFDGSGGYFAKHSAALSLISVITAQKMGWASDYTGIKLVMASMLHDFSLTDHQVESLTDIVPMINNPKYSEVEDVIAVREHPRKAAEMVRGIRGLPLGIDEVLLQHHERPDGSGFPSRLVWKEIAPLSALFIVCEDLVDDFFLSKALGEFDLSSFAEKRKSVYSKGPFKEILTALAKIEDHSK
ncbi:MAG: hypothetical protein KDD61_12360, partial [Bdellovibrionales bacterium]|nr:hypothetical protein [Bdellovibrionales bacterium]